jgi:hypothetical protein
MDTCVKCGVCLRVLRYRWHTAAATLQGCILTYQHFTNTLPTLYQHFTNCLPPRLYTKLNVWWGQSLAANATGAAADAPTVTVWILPLDFSFLWGMTASVWPQCDNSATMVSMPFLLLRHRHTRACLAHCLIQVHPVRDHCSRPAGWRKGEAALCPPIACVHASLATVVKQYTHTCGICIVNSGLKLLFEKRSRDQIPKKTFFCRRSLYGQFHDYFDLNNGVFIIVTLPSGYI